jgi:glutathione S-transferase
MGIKPNSEIVDYTTAKFNEKLDIFEGILGKQKYMGGSEFSLVDIFYLPNTKKLFEIGEGALITKRQMVNDWWERCSGRASWKKIYKPVGA